MGFPGIGGFLGGVLRSFLRALGELAGLLLMRLGEGSLLFCNLCPAITGTGSLSQFPDFDFHF